MSAFLALTPKQQRFCDEYLIGLNATKAALRAGYSASTALNGKLMTLPKIKNYLQQRTEQASSQLQVTHQMILAELSKIAFANMGNYFDADGKVKPMNALTDDAKAALWNFSVSDNGEECTVKIRLNNKLSALEKIAKYLKFYEAEAPQPEKEYVYLDKEDLEEDDLFDDESFDEEDDDWDEEEEEDNDTITAEREEYIRQQAISETETRMRQEFEAELIAMNKDLGEKLAQQAAPPAPVNPYQHLKEPIGYRLEQRRNLRRAVPEKYYLGVRL